jgi:hypothetical protein
LGPLDGNILEVVSGKHGVPDPDGVTGMNGDPQTEREANPEMKKNPCW